MGRITDWLLGPVALEAANAAPVSLEKSSLASPSEWTGENSRENFARITLSHLFGNLDAVPVNRDSALGVGAVDRLQQLICGTISTLPVMVVVNGQVSKTTNSFVQQPEAGRPASQTWLWIADSLFFYGHAYLLVTERFAEDNRPKRVQFAADWNVSVDTAGRVYEVFGRPVKDSDVIRIDGPHSGILNRPRRIREAIAIDVAASNASANPVPSINLHQTQGDPMSKDAIQEMIQIWVDARSQGGTGGVGFTNQSVEAIAMGQNPEQLLIAGRNVTALNIARMANAPAWAVDASVEGSSLTYSNVPSRSRELLDFTLSPYLTAIVSRLSMDDVLPSTTRIRFDTSGLLRGDAKTRADTYKIWIDSGIYTEKECRQMEAGTFTETAQ